MCVSVCVHKPVDKKLLLPVSKIIPRMKATSLLKTVAFETSVLL